MLTSIGGKNAAIVTMISVMDENSKWCVECIRSGDNVKNVSSQ